MPETPKSVKNQSVMPQSVTSRSETPDVHGPWTGEQALDAGFIDVARHVYAGDPEWLPEDPLQLSYLFSQKHPYFLFGKVWLGFSDKQARLAGFCDPRQLIDGERCAYFGYWETIDQADINQVLFTEFEDWARAQGATRVYGPINFNTYGLYRIRTNHFGQPCFQGEPYNPEYYPELLKALGYEVAFNYFSQFDHDIPGMLQAMEVPYAKCRQKMGAGFSMIPLTPDYWMQHLEPIYHLSELVFQSNFAYTPINFDIFKSLCGTSFINKAHPQASWVALDTEQNRIAGMLLCFPSWGPLLKQGCAQRLNATEIDYARHADLLPRPRMALAKTTGVDPYYRSKGLYTVMMYHLARAAIDTGYEDYGAVLVKEDNLSLGMAAKASIRRTYALYWKNIA